MDLYNCRHRFLVIVSTLMLVGSAQGEGPLLRGFEIDRVVYLSRDEGGIYTCLDVNSNNMAVSAGFTQPDSSGITSGLVTLLDDCQVVRSVSWPEQQRSTIEDCVILEESVFLAGTSQAGEDATRTIFLGRLNADLQLDWMRRFDGSGLHFIGDGQHLQVMDERVLLLYNGFSSRHEIISSSSESDQGLFAFLSSVSLSGHGLSSFQIRDGYYSSHGYALAANKNHSPLIGGYFVKSISASLNVLSRPVGAAIWSINEAPNVDEIAVYPEARTGNISHLKASPHGNIVFAGTTGHSFGGVLGEPARRDDIVIGSVDCHGDLLWSKVVGGSGYDWVTDLELFSDGSFLLTGLTDSDDFLAGTPARTIKGIRCDGPSSSDGVPLPSELEISSSRVRLLST